MTFQNELQNMLLAENVLNEDIPSLLGGIVLSIPGAKAIEKFNANVEIKLYEKLLKKFQKAYDTETGEKNRQKYGTHISFFQWNLSQLQEYVNLLDKGKNAEASAHWVRYLKEYPKQRKSFKEHLKSIDTGILRTLGKLFSGNKGTKVKSHYRKSTLS